MDRKKCVLESPGNVVYLVNVFWCKGYGMCVERCTSKIVKIGLIIRLKHSKEKLVWRNVQVPNI